MNILLFPINLLTITHTMTHIQRHTQKAQNAQNTQNLHKKTHRNRNEDTST